MRLRYGKTTYRDAQGRIQGTMKKLGLALGGGGARGLAHIGVIKALKELNVPIQCVAGEWRGQQL